MEEKELVEKYQYIEKFLLDNGADNQYLECLDEVFLLAKTKITTSNSDYE